MGGSNQSRQNASLTLPSDLWARVFAAKGASPLKPILGQADTKRLALVCRAFNHIINSDTRFTSAVCLDSVQPRSLSSLLNWLQSHGSSVRSLSTAYTTSVMEATFDGLLVCAGSLKAVEVGNCSPSAVMMLENFTSLASCELQNLQHRPLDLTPLQGLMSMINLILCSQMQGTFTALQLPPCLEVLTLTETTLTVAEACCCTSSLKELDLSTSSLCGLHPDGLSTCCALTKLGCCGRCMIPSSADMELDFADMSWLPPGLPSLTGLTSINLYLISDIDETTDFVSLNGLVNLVKVYICSESSLGISSGFAALTNLQQLTLEVEPEDAYGQILRLSVDVDWKDMQCLQHLSFGTASFVCMPNLLTLLKVPRLRCINLVLLIAHNNVSCNSYGMLLHGLGKYRPDIDVSFVPTRFV